MSDLKYEMKGANGQLMVYEDKVIIERKGANAFLYYGFAGAKTIPLSSIKSVQFKKAGKVFGGYIQFSILGGVECQGGLNNAISDENSVMIAAKDNDIAQKIKDYVESRIIEYSKPQVTVAQQLSAADELKQYKELLDMDIITQEEFDSKKKQLLGL